VFRYGVTIFSEHTAKNTHKKILNAEIASKADHSFRLALPIRLSSAASLPQPEGEQVGGKAAAAAAAAAAADVSSDSPPPVHSPYKTVSCTLDLNGPLIYYVPSGLVQPMLRVKVGKIVVVGDANVPDPRLGPRALCNYHVSTIIMKNKWFEKWGEKKKRT